MQYNPEAGVRTNLVELIEAVRQLEKRLAQLERPVNTNTKK